MHAMAIAGSRWLIQIWNSSRPFLVEDQGDDGLQPELDPDLALLQAALANAHDARPREIFVGQEERLAEHMRSQKDPMDQGLLI